MLCHYLALTSPLYTISNLSLNTLPSNCCLTVVSTAQQPSRSSQDHRTIQGGRDLRGSVTQLQGQAGSAIRSDQAAQGLILSGLETLQRWSLCNLSWQSELLLFRFLPVDAHLQKAWPPQDMYSDKHFPLSLRRRRKRQNRKKSPQRLLSKPLGLCLQDCHLFLRHLPQARPPSAQLMAVINYQPPRSTRPARAEVTALNEPPTGSQEQTVLSQTWQACDMAFSQCSACRQITYGST